MAPRIGTLSSTRYTIIVDAGSSGSRLIIYSYQDPEAERNQIISSVRKKYERFSKGKGKDRAGVEDEIRWEVERSLRRLVKVEKGAEGDNWMKKAEPGISATTPASIPGYLNPLLSHALQQIPPSQHAHTPIYILATAGMRLLPSDQSSAILAATCSTLRKDYPFKLDSANELGPCGDSVRIASGEEEGMWGWVAVNYLMDGFGHVGTSREGESILPLAPLETDMVGGLEKHIPATVVDVKHQSPTFGFLDMGGASTQIAFSPSISELSRSGFPPSELRSVSLRLLSGQAVEWPLFVASWLGFGTNKARERYIERKVLDWQKQNEYLTSTRGPAHPDSLPTNAAKPFQPIEDPCLPLGLKLPSTSPTQPSFIGTGSFSTCLTELQPLLERTAPCPAPASHCLFAGLPTPHIDFEREDQRGFIGISEYWYTAQQVLGLGGVWDWAEWERGMEGFCGKEWGEIAEEFQKENGWKGNAVELSRLEMQCFKGAWISNILHDGIGIPRLTDKGGDQTLTGGGVGDTAEEAARRAEEKGLISRKHSHFQSVDTIGETAVSWTLGKMVIEASKAVAPHGYADKPIGTNSRWSKAWTSGRGKLSEVLGIPKLESKLAEHGIEAFWLYLFVSLLIVFFAYSTLRRRIGLTRATMHKRRKQSDAGAVRDWLRRRSQMGSGGMEEGNGSATPRKGLFAVGRFKPFAYRLSAALSKLAASKRSEEYGRPRTTRQMSSPGLTEHLELPDRMDSYSATTSMSLPSSPRHEAYFIPALSSGVTSGYSSDSEAVSAETTPRQTPSRLAPDSSRALGQKASQNSLRNKHSLSPLKLSTTENGSGGWNDPPVSVLDAGENRLADGGPSTTLIPPAASKKTLSRSSSRINLPEHGMSLAARPVSRGSPSPGEDPGGP